MGNCKDCKWWSSEQWYSSLLARQCNRIGEMHHSRKDETFAFLVSGDYAESDGLFLTLPDFGCVLFEVKE
jgi:hypothetical protein